VSVKPLPKSTMDESASEDAFMPSLLLGEPLLVLVGEMDTTRVERKSMGPVKSCMGM
jgi:hypothetical protein